MGKRLTLGRSDWLTIAGLLAAVGAGAALYGYRENLQAVYERHFEPERYWAGQVRGLRFRFELAELDRRACTVDVLAARMKESIRAARYELYGISSSNARAEAARETMAQQQTCEVFAEATKRDRQALADAELEHEQAKEDQQIAAGLIPAHSSHFLPAWQAAEPPWSLIEAAPKYRVLDAAGKDSVRASYWHEVISPKIPTEELRRARKQFDQFTATRTP